MTARATRAAVVAALLVAAAGIAAAEAPDAGPAIQSMSVLAFGPGGVLFVGDGKGGAVFALEIPDEGETSWPERHVIPDLEGRIAARLGTTADEVLIHDLAVHPATRRIYLAVSRGRAGWTNAYQLPNELADATLLLRLDGEGRIDEVPLQGVPWARAALPDPVDPAKNHRWKKGVSLRADTITDIAVADGVVYVAGLSNEEFASTLWTLPYPFADGVRATTLEIYHGAHGAYETHAPIRTFVPYDVGGERHLLAAYLCTPFVTFRAAELEDGRHVRGRTLGEFGYGNYPLDMVVFRKEGRERLLIANTSLPLMIVKPEDIESFEGKIEERTESYVAGLPYEPRPGSGIQQLDVLSESAVVVLKRQPGGTLDLQAVPTAHL